MSAKQSRFTRRINCYESAPHWLFGASTLLIDRAVADVERIYLPPAVSTGGEIVIEREVSGRFAATRSGLRALQHWFRGDAILPIKDEPVLDLRAYSPGNWSHALMIHLPLAAVAADYLGCNPVALLPFDIPRFVRNAFAHFGFQTIATDREVVGNCWRASFSDVNIMKNIVLEVMRDRADQLRRTYPADAALLPTKIFMARRGGRSVRNQTEIEAVLHPRGYQTVYPEDLSVLDQFRLLDLATDVVAVHGAGLSPLCYRNPSAPTLRAIEIMPAAHMTNYFRLVFDQLGADYRAVRGRITAADANGAYAEAPYVAHSLDPFEVDPQSLEFALADASGQAWFSDRS